MYSHKLDIYTYVNMYISFPKVDFKLKKGKNKHNYLWLGREVINLN